MYLTSSGQYKNTKNIPSSIRALFITEQNNNKKNPYIGEQPPRERNRRTSETKFQVSNKFLFFQFPMIHMLKNDRTTKHTQKNKVPSGENLVVGLHSHSALDWPAREERMIPTIRP